MSGEWIETTIGEQATLQRGYDITKKDQRAGHVPVISSSGLSSYHDIAMVKGPGIVLGRKGVLGSVFYVAQDHWPHDTTLWVKDFHGNEPKYVYYFFKKWSQRFLSMDVGSANPTLNRNHVHPIKILWPPRSEQKAIAEILGALDDKIELDRSMNETLEAMARAIFKSWFVDFDPVRAKSEGRRPFGMDAATATLFPSSYEDSRLGKTPKNWRVVTLPEAIEINPSRTLAKNETTTYLDMQNMPTNGHRVFGWTQRAFVSGSKFTNGDTLVARITPCLENGKTAFVDFLHDREVAWGSTEFIVLRPKEPLPPEYGYCLARGEDFRMHAIRNMTGSSGRQRVATSCFSQYLMTVPPDGIADAFGRTIRPLFAKAKANSEEAATLASLRDLLLPKLISGEIRIKDAEKMVGEKV